MLRASLSLFTSSASGVALPAMQHMLRVTQHCCYASKGKGSTSQPGKAKRPLNGYQLFVKDRSASMTGTGGTATDMVKQIAQEWKSMTDDQKAPYQKEAASLKAQMPKQQKPEVQKRPANAYNLFFQEQYSQVAAGGLKVTDAAKEIGARWKALPEAEKARYKATAEEAMRAYKASQGL